MEEPTEDSKWPKTLIKYSDTNVDNGECVYNEENKQILSPSNNSTLRRNEDEKLYKLMVLVDRLGLKEFYPEKMQLCDVIKIQQKCPPIWSKQAFEFVKNLIMTNYTCRDQMVQEYIQQIKQIVKERCKHLHKEMEENKAANALDNLFGDDEDNVQADYTTDSLINPLDLTLTVFRCSSPELKSILVKKLFACKLAIPFVYPVLETECITVSFWPLRSVIMETIVDKGPAQNMSVDCPCHIVACIRLGRPSVSKSKLINEVLNDQYHNTFFNKDCSLGTSNRCISDGLIEAAWYIPSRKSKLMNSLTMFLNLRGDGLYYSKQLQLLSELATVLVVFLDMRFFDNPEIKEQLFSLYECKISVLLAIDANTYSKAAVKGKLQLFLNMADQTKQNKIKFAILTVDGTMRSISVIKDEIRRAVCELIKNATFSSLSERLAKLHTKLDEDEDIYKKVKHSVKSMMDLIPDKYFKSKVLPLQGTLWQSYSKKLKLVNKSSQYKSMHEAGNMRNEMNADRMRQAEICNNLGPFMTHFLNFVFESLNSDNKFQLFVLWTKLVLDERSRTVLPDVLSKYQFDWQAIKTARDKKDMDSIPQLQNELDKSKHNLAEAAFGFEHLYREIGQMFEALSACQLHSCQLQEIRNTLPAIAVQLLIMGEPFEIMDGDASNVPMLWVKAVLSRLKDVLGDKRLLALSVLGIQSSGKSTLLNTMFGLQFAVSAGRCTKGVFMQLVQVADKTLPFDYILVIDTEGLRAPELAHEKYSHDNELATFVIGLGDITIVNIKGENTAELKDILQISVHAFLRLKLANKRLNLKQSCIFVHQNVPAIDANDKMMQGRQKFVEALDEMTKEAASQENIADIQCFNQVIEFNSEENVWYFSDLWRGDPPMAPVNQGYSENVSNVKESLMLHMISRRMTHLTITDTITRIEDLWNGILKDDFVFSFRNSLELKAYNIMEQHCQTITLSLEKYVSEYIRSNGKNSLLNAKDVQELEKKVPAIIMELSKEVDKKIQLITKHLVDFVDKNALKDIMMQWLQHKRNRFQILADSLLLNAKTYINNTKEEIRITKLKLSEKTNHEMEINILARQLAIEMRGEIPNEVLMKEKFNFLWSSWIDKFSTKELNNVAAQLLQIDAIVREKYGSDSTFFTTINQLEDVMYYKTLKRLEGSFKVNWISEKEHLSIPKYLFEYMWKGEETEVCKKQSIDVLNMIFREIDTKLAELNSQDIRFDMLYVTEILDIVTRRIADFNLHDNNEYTFNFLSPFRALVIMHVVNYVSAFFAELDEKYNQKHSPKAQIEEYKGTAWNLFKNVVQSKAEEVIAVGFFREAIIKVVVEHVEQLLPFDVQEHIIVLFANGKYSLIKDILIHLAKTDDFEQIKSYIMNPNVYAEKWILNLTNERIFVKTENNMNVFVNLARTRIAKLLTQLSITVSEAMKRCINDQNCKVSYWIKCLLDINGDMEGLPISPDELKHVTNGKVSDLPSFNEMVVKSILEMESHIVDIFKNIDSNSVKWKENPISQIMKKLWGCSEVCMFCKEPCMNTDKEHVSINQPHRCLQHRPKGIAGVRWMSDNKLAIECCNNSITTDTEFRISKDNFGEYKDYKKYFPHWDIPPNSDVSKYWMWLLNKYKHDFSKMYYADLPDIPDYWGSITQKQALDSL